MKTNRNKKNSKTLFLNKKTLVVLNNNQLNVLKGGNVTGDNTSVLCNGYHATICGQ